MFKIILFLLITLSAVADIHAKRPFIRTLKRKQSTLDYSQEGKLSSNSTLALLKTLRATGYCPCVNQTIEDDEEDSFDNFNGGLRNKNRNGLPISAYKNELLRRYDEMCFEVSYWLHTYLNENDIDSFKDNVDQMLRNVVTHLINDRDKDYVYKKTIRSNQDDPTAIKPVKVVCDFFQSLHAYVKHCEGESCDLKPEEVNFEEELRSSRVIKQRFGAEHDVLAQAVKDLAEKLQAAGNPDDDAMILLANAVHHLFDDITILQETSPTTNNVNVIITILEILDKADQCSQNTQCQNDWYYLYGRENKYPKTGGHKGKKATSKKN